MSTDFSKFEQCKKDYSDKMSALRKSFNRRSLLYLILCFISIAVCALFLPPWCGLIAIWYPLVSAFGVVKYNKKAAQYEKDFRDSYDKIVEKEIDCV